MPVPPGTIQNRLDGQPPAGDRLPEPPIVLQGAELFRLDKLKQRAEELSARPGAKPTWPLGGLELPHKLLYNHVLFLGTTGSGKTTLINQVKRDVLKRIRRGSGHRACIWDFKSEELQYLATLELWHPDPSHPNPGRMNPNCPVYYINPADKRGVGINVALDVTNALEADQFASDMIAPKSKEDSENAVWVEAARNCLSQVVQAFQKSAPAKWKLIDVVEACYYSDKLTHILSKTRMGRATVKDSLGPGDQARGVFFTIQSFAKRLRPIAAAMSRTEGTDRAISLSRWINGEEGIVVIGNHPVLKENLAPLQRWIFGQLVRNLLVQEQTEVKRYLFFLDEVRQAPFGTYLAELATAGRSKGASMIVGLQDSVGLKETIGDNNAVEFLGMFDTMVFLRLKSPETAEWASKYFGKHMRVLREESESQTRNEGTSGQINTSYSSSLHGGKTTGYGSGWNRGEGVSVSYSYKPVERTLVYPNQFRQLKQPRVEEGKGRVVEAYVSIAGVGDGKMIVNNIDKLTIDPYKEIPNHQVITDSKVFEFDWRETDLDRLGLTDPEDLVALLSDDSDKPRAGGASKTVTKHERPEEPQGQFVPVGPGVFVRVTRGAM